MKGDPRIITALNARLIEEFTAENQYGAHEALARNWQFGRFADYLAERKSDEQKHQKMLLDQILFLGGTPSTGQLNPVQVGVTVQQMLELDHTAELGAIRGYNATIALCVELQDEITAGVLREILRDEADHTNDIEARQAQIAQCGIGPFLAAQIGGGSGC